VLASALVSTGQAGELLGLLLSAGRLVELWEWPAARRLHERADLRSARHADTEWCAHRETSIAAMLYAPVRGECAPLVDWPAPATHPPGSWAAEATALDGVRLQPLHDHVVTGGELDGVRLLSSRTVELMTENHLTRRRRPEALATDSFSETSYAGRRLWPRGCRWSTDRRKTVLVFEGRSLGPGRRRTAFWIRPLEDLTVSCLHPTPAQHHLSGSTRTPRGSSIKRWRIRQRRGVSLEGSGGETHNGEPSRNTRYEHLFVSTLKT